MRAQIQNQVFIYIMAALLIGVVFYFGYKGIVSIGNTASTAALVQFKAKVPQDIASLSTGESREYYVKVPAGYSVCFVNTSSPSPAQISDATVRNFLSDAYNSTGKNLFLINKNTKSVEPIATVALSVQENVLCLDSSGNVILENTGRTIKVRKH